MCSICQWRNRGAGQISSVGVDQRSAMVFTLLWGLAVGYLDVFEGAAR